MTSINVDDDELPLVEQLDPPPDAVEVFRRLASLPHVVFFDSAMRHAKLGRYSFVAADPVEWLAVPADGSDALAVTVDTDCGFELRMLIQQSEIASPRSCRPFKAGGPACSDTNLHRSLEAVPAAAIDEFKIPALAVGLYDVVVAFDHEQDAAWLISQGMPERDPTTRRERAAIGWPQFQSLLLCNKAAAEQKVNADSTSALSVDKLSPQFRIAGQDGLTSNFSADRISAGSQDRQSITFTRATCSK